MPIATQVIDVPKSQQSAQRADSIASATNQNFARLTLVVGENTALLVTTPNGNSAGSRFFGGSLEAIPNSTYYSDSITDDVTGEPGRVTRTLNIQNPTPGRFLITLTGIHSGDYELTVFVRSSDRAPEPTLRRKGQIVAGAEIRFQLSVTTTPGSVSSLDTTPQVTVSTAAVE